ncbi:hypothetical protein HJG60_008200 [Phyllostomus discolor]|uniref:Uncharacterized protein n=1 Tax=Phyllostomus discolor TaxID=89673 RepID=A0A833Z1F8_9CHIR|nr:hypothetical protein HJG60_008200 [Phyllostomus discolor]
MQSFLPTSCESATYPFPQAPVSVFPRFGALLVGDPGPSPLPPPLTPPSTVSPPEGVWARGPHLRGGPWMTSSTNRCFRPPHPLPKAHPWHGQDTEVNADQGLLIAGPKACPEGRSRSHPRQKVRMPPHRTQSFLGCPPAPAAPLPTPKSLWVSCSTFPSSLAGCSNANQCRDTRYIRFSTTLCTSTLMCTERGCPRPWEASYLGTLHFCLLIPGAGASRLVSLSKRRKELKM